jgi:small subunit ribosomal protein S16
MVKIRLRRIGAKHKPLYRIVVADSESPREGAFIEIIGTYNPLVNPEGITVKEDSAMKWLEQGAQPTETAYRLLAKAGVMEKFTSAHPTRKFRQAVQKTTQRQKKSKKPTS